MGAKRNSKKPHGPAGSGRKVDVDSDEIGALPATPGLQPPPATMDVPVAAGEPSGEGEDRSKPFVQKAPERRGGDRFIAAGRGRGAPQARRYAFRRS